MPCTPICMMYINDVSYASYMKEVIYKDINREFGVSTCNLLHLEWISIEVMTYSTVNYFQSLGIGHEGRKYKKECVCVCVYDFPVYQKLIQHCNAMIL